MISDFEFRHPHTLSEALKLLSQNKDNARALAGGTDIMPGFLQELQRFRNVKCLIDINNIPELKSIKANTKSVSIGAAVTFSEIINNKILAENFPLLIKAASTIGSLQIRNRATIGGNFINNAPCSDSVPPLLVYDAKIILRSIKGRKILPLADFLIKPYHTRLQSDQLVTRIILPKLSSHYLGDFCKLGRRRGVAISRVSLAILINLEDKTIRDMRIASGAVTPIGIRLKEVEKISEGQKISDDFLKKLSQETGAAILNITGSRWSTPYKLPVVQQMFYQLLRHLTNQ
jgi:xanthine dehydrogenase FAD-binding subunit